MRRDTPQYVTGLARNLRRNQTEAENLLWEKLRGNRLNGYKFRRQYAVGRYIVDFYCSKALLALEIDRKIHELVSTKEYDIQRQKELIARGIKVLRFTNKEILEDLNTVISKILNELDHN